MDNTIQLYVDEEREIKAYPITSPDRVIDENGVNIAKHQHIKRETGSIPNNVYDNTTLIVEKEYNGFNTSSNGFEGGSIHAITTAKNNSGKVQGTIHGITSQVIYKDMGGDNRSELAPLFLDCNSENGGSLWGVDLNINAPFPHNEKAYRILGQVIRMSNYHDNTVDGSAGLSVVTIPGTGGAGEDRYHYESKPIDVGIAITGYSGKNDLSVTNIGFKTALQIGGRVTGWQPIGANSEIGTAIELSQFKQGILVKNTPLGTPLLTVKDCYSDSNNIELINYSGAVQFIGEDSSKQLLTLRKNGEVNIANSIIVNTDGIHSFKKNNVTNMEIDEGLNYIDIVFNTPINNAYYNVFIELNWLTTYRVINKTNVGFRIEFGSPSVIGSKIGYFAVAN